MEVVLAIIFVTRKQITELENQIISTVKETNSTLTIGVIPFVCEGIKEKTDTQGSIPLSENKLNILKMGIKKLILTLPYMETLIKQLMNNPDLNL